MLQLPHKPKPQPFQQNSNLKLFKLSEHPQIGPHIQDMKSEINKYHALVYSIKSLDERKDVKGKDTFSLPERWRCNSGSLPHFSFVFKHC
jgi:hypothetical protein